MSIAARLLKMVEARYMEPCRTEEQAHAIIRHVLHDIQNRMTQDEAIQKMGEWCGYDVVSDDYKLKPDKPCYGWTRTEPDGKQLMLFKNSPVICLQHKELDDLVRHEFAHAYIRHLYRNGETIGHSDLWVKTAQRFGGSGKPKGFD